MTTMLEIALQSSAFILLLLLLRPWMKKILTARMRYALWSIPLLRLALPISIKSTFSIWGHTGLHQTSPTLVPSKLLLAKTVPSRVEIGLMNQSVKNAASELATKATQGGQAIRSSPWHELLPQLVLWIWFVGVGVMLTWMIVTNYRFHRMVRHKKQLITFGVPLPIYLVEHLPSPCLVGVLRPRILVNRTSIQSQEMLDMVVSHEMTHFHHGDNLWTLLRTLLLCIWWWNPLMWAAVKYSKEDCEAACDETVTKKMTRAERQIYGLSLIELMRQDTRSTLQLSVGTAMRSGKKQMEERIKMIKSKESKSRLIMLVFALCFTLMLPLLFTSAVAGTASGEKDNTVVFSDNHLQPQYEEYLSKLEQMISLYGDPNQWSLEQDANASLMAQEYGLSWDEGKVHVLPGSDDIEEKDAIVKAENFAKQNFEITTDDILSKKTSFYYQEGSPNERIWRVKFEVKPIGRDVAIVLNSKGELIDTWISDVEKRGSAPAVLDSDELQKVFQEKPVVIAAEFLTGIIDVVWFDFPYHWYPSLSRTHVEEYSNEEIWLVVLHNEAMKSELKVLVSGEGEVLAWAMPGSGFTSLRPADTKALLSEAKTVIPKQEDMSEAAAIKLAKAILQDQKNLNDTEIDSYRFEAHSIQHSKFANGKEPVWLVLQYNSKSVLAYKTLFTLDGQLLGFTTAGMGFSSTVRR